MRAESPEAEKHSLPLRATTLTNTASVTNLANALDDKSSTAWTVDLAGDRTEAGIFELPEVAHGSNQVIFKLELNLSPDETAPAWRLRLPATDFAAEPLVPPAVL